jgi:hypothetical protein
MSTRVKNQQDPARRRVAVTPGGDVFQHVKSLLTDSRDLFIFSYVLRGLRQDGDGPGLVAQATGTVADFGGHRSHLDTWLGFSSAV